MSEMHKKTPIEVRTASTESVLMILKYFFGFCVEKTDFYVFCVKKKTDSDRFCVKIDRLSLRVHEISKELERIEL